MSFLDLSNKTLLSEIEPGTEDDFKGKVKAEFDYSQKVAPNSFMCIKDYKKLEV